MKYSNKLILGVKSLLLLFLFSLMKLVAWAQEKHTDINVNINKGNAWYNEPWVWVVGGAVFLLLLVALLRGGGNKD
jgi:hypothetical protein